MTDTMIAVGTSRLELIRGDITKQVLDAIANAANSKLAGGGGVDGAIHRAGGPSIMQALRASYPQGCPTGSAVITPGGNLTAKYVLHAVGPVYSGLPKDAELLARAYQSCLELCVKYNVRSIAFPSISTGVYHYPIDEAAIVALQTVKEFLATQSVLTLVRFVLFDEKTLNAYEKVLKRL